MQNLSSQQIEELLNGLPEWYLENDKLCAEWSFTNFIDAMLFLNKVAILAEEHSHHPEIYNRFNFVKLSLTSHDSGGLTHKDFRLAKAINNLLS